MKLQDYLKETETRFININKTDDVQTYVNTIKARADKDGYCNYQDSQFIKNLKK